MSGHMSHSRYSSHAGRAGADRLGASICPCDRVLGWAAHLPVNPGKRAHALRGSP